MNSIGIIANPASGKDIRRLVSHATIIDNNEKTNIVERIILGAQALGTEKVYIMPDLHNLGRKAENNLRKSNKLRCEINIINMSQFNTMKDSIKAAEYMENKDDIKCIVTLGGDGTNRAVAKSVKQTPIIAISTGTNNVYPVMIEGTVAGMAAAATASESFDQKIFIARDKRIEIYKEGKLLDIALIDAVIATDAYVGSKAIWNMDKIKKIFVTKCHPSSIGFSSLLGCKKIIYSEDDLGACVDINLGHNKIKAPIAAGLIESISIGEPEILRLNDSYEYTSETRGTIALDGEREIEFKERENFVFKISRTGPYHVDVIKALETAQLNGFFIKQDC